MIFRSTVRKVIPSALGVAMLGVVVAAALTPNVGVIPAQAGCQYGNCGPPAPNYTYVYLGIAAVIVAGIIAGVLLGRRRRRGPAEEFAGRRAPPRAPVAEYEEPPAGAVGGEMEYFEEAPPPVEPEVPMGPEAPGAPPGEGPTTSDIDSLMDELDRISGEILKKGPPKRGPPPTGSDESTTQQ